MPVIEQKTTNKNKVDFDLNRLDKSKTTIFSKYPFFIDPTVSAPRVHGRSDSVGAGAGLASSDSVCADADSPGASPATLCVRR